MHDWVFKDASQVDSVMLQVALALVQAEQV
jgi:hypothetical protein